MVLTERELTIVQSVFEELLYRKYSELNGYLGSETIKEMQKLYSKLSHREYCERHGIKYEDMTEFDFEAEYAERWEA